MNILESEYKVLLQARLKLAALEEAGVENWGGYSEAMAAVDRANRYENLLDETEDAVNDVLCAATVEQPAGPDCGYSITLPESAVRCLLKTFIAQYMESQK